MPCFGFDPAHLLSVRLTTGPIQSARMRNILIEVTSAIRRLPGVLSVAAEAVNPIGRIGIAAESARLAADERAAVAAHRVTADYFAVMGLPLVAGRLPNELEWQPPNDLAVITERAAHTLGGPQSSIGQVVQLSRDRRRATVIGVVGNMRLRYDDVEPRQIVFIPPPPDRWITPGLVVRTSADAKNTNDQIRAIVARVMPRAVPEFVQ